MGISPFKGDSILDTRYLANPLSAREFMVRQSRFSSEFPGTGPFVYMPTANKRAWITQALIQQCGFFSLLFIPDAARLQVLLDSAGKYFIKVIFNLCLPGLCRTEHVSSPSR